MKFLRTPWGQQVLDELLDKVAHERGLVASEALSDEVDATMARVGPRHIARRPRPEILNPSGVWSSSMLPYILFYRFSEEGAPPEFLGILHYKQDVLTPRMI